MYLHYRNDGNHRPRNEKGARQSNSWLTEWDNVMDFDSMDFGVYKSGVRIKEGNDLSASRPGVGWED